MNHLKEGSEFIREARSKNAPVHLKYFSLEEFVLKNGSPFKEIDTSWSKFGEVKACYSNSYHLALKHGFAYVEGYALGIIPVIHAWNLDHEGRVVDSTWGPNLTEKFSGRAYFGVQFDQSYVMQTVIERKYYGVLENMEQNFPLLHGAEGWRPRAEQTKK